ncbi:MAG: hypothetical protein WDA09_01925 [Bacteriovoracaceae bacterium]
MKLLSRIEERVNEWLWGVIYFLDALIPLPFKHSLRFLKRKIRHGFIRCKMSPWFFLKKKNQAQEWLKSVIAEIQFKETLTVVENKLKNEQNFKNLYIKLRRFLTIVAHLIKRPFRGLSPQQGLVLIVLTASSLMAGLSIFFQSQRIYLEETKHLRTPASVEVLEFDRPAYYKEELRHVQIFGVRVPVYYPQVNELQTVTIDFNITLSNRIGRVFIEKREFPLRDHLIQNLEPTLAQYSLNEEGKAIIKEKIAQEVQDFLDHHQIESEVKDVTLLYILAN